MRRLRGRRHTYCRAAPNLYGAGDVACWHNPLFGAPMRIERRTYAGEQNMAAARSLLQPEARKPFAPAPYFWSDQYDMRIQAYEYPRDHEQAAFMEGDLTERWYVAAYRTGETLTGVLADGVPSKAIHPPPGTTDW